MGSPAYMNCDVFVHVSESTRLIISTDLLKLKDLLGSQAGKYTVSVVISWMCSSCYYRPVVRSDIAAIPMTLSDLEGQVTYNKTFRMECFYVQLCSCS